MTPTYAAPGEYLSDEAADAVDAASDEACGQCGSDDTYVSVVSWHNTVRVCRTCAHERQIYLAKEM